MKRRSVDILLKILRHKKKINIDKLSGEYNVSVRTLKKDISEINAFLETIGQSGIFLDDKGYLCLTESCDYKLVNDELFKIDIYTYKMSQEERCIYIIVLLTIQTDYITMEKIAAELFVSRITILSDIEIVKGILAGNQIRIISKSSRGILLSYREEDFRLMMIKLFQKIIINVRSEGFFQRLMIKKLNMTYPLADFVKLIQHFEKDSDIAFSEQTFYQNTLYLFVACNRIMTGHPILQDHPHHNNYAAGILDYIAGKLAVPFNRNEKKFYSCYIENKHLLPLIKTNKDIETANIIMYFLSKIGRNLKIDFQEDHLLVESLLLHLKSMANAAKLDITIEEDGFPREYKELLMEVNNNIYILERYLGFTLSEDLKISIAIHICASLVRNRAYVKKLSVLIACPGSVATGKLLEAQVKNYFNFNIAGIVSIGRISNELEIQNKQVDFVITTVTVENVSCPVITVNPLLEIEDLNAIQKQAFLMGHQEKQAPVTQEMRQKLEQDLEDSLQLIKNQGDVDKALDNIESAINEFRKPAAEKSVALAKMLHPDHIRIEPDKMDWEKALQSVGRILEHQYYGSEYVEQIVANVKEYGPYIVLSPGVALAHAGSDCSVYQDGLSLIVSPQGITFEGGINVYLLFCFCTTGDSIHLPLFKEIIELGKNGMVEKLIKLSREDEVYQELLRQ